MSTDANVAVEQMRVADRHWQAALNSSSQAPPDLGFSKRLRELADAAEQEQSAFRLADRLGLVWQPVAAARDQTLSYELRRGGPRRGPGELWTSFDEAVATLGAALEGVALSAISRAFGELSEIARELASEIERIDFPAQERRRAG